jgi:hypothetical protein
MEAVEASRLAARTPRDSKEQEGDDAKPHVRFHYIDRHGCGASDNIADVTGVNVVRQS